MRERLPANFGKPWTPGEDAIVAAAYDAGAPLVQIAREQHRTQSSVRLRLEKLGKIEAI